MLEIEYLGVEKLKPYDKNAKIHDEVQIEQIMESIKQFGMNDPIAIWKDGLIIEGHGRLVACKRLGIMEVPVIRLDHLSDEQRKAYTLVHNKLTMNTEFDIDILTAELSEIVDIDMNDFGFEVDDLLWEEEEEPTENERARTGDAYNLGDVDSSRLAGKWQMPIIRKTNHVPKDLISFNYVLSTNHYERGVHFYIDDYQFERIWNDPYTYINKLVKYDCVLTPDFSLYTEMPLAMQIWNVYRSRMIGQMLQDAGCTVIPTLQWCREDSFEFCFDGLEEGGTVSVSTIGVKRAKDAGEKWVKGMDEAMARLHPKHVVVYGGDIGYEFNCPVTYIENHNTERMYKKE